MWVHDCIAYAPFLPLLLSTLGQKNGGLVGGIWEWGGGQAWVPAPYCIESSLASDPGKEEEEANSWVPYKCKCRWKPPANHWKGKWGGRTREQVQYCSFHHTASSFIHFDSENGGQRECWGGGREPCVGASFLLRKRWVGGWRERWREVSTPDSCRWGACRHGSKSFQGLHSPHSRPVALELMELWKGV